ncbi:hypothetical protein SODG_000601 [Sodalis praecaptivus]
MTEKSSAHTTAVPAVTFSKTGLLVPDEVDILNGRLSDFSTALGGAMSTSLTTPQGQLASSEAAIIAARNDQLLALVNQINPDFASGRFQDAIGRLYFIDRLGATGTTVTAICTGWPVRSCRRAAWRRMRRAISIAVWRRPPSGPREVWRSCSRTRRRGRYPARHRG